jgi:hypothetical protein
LTHGHIDRAAVARTAAARVARSVQRRGAFAGRYADSREAFSAVPDALPCGGAHTLEMSNPAAAFLIVSPGS